ncbi:MAG: pyridoxal phosphate-dependent aminotransferase [Betaproteobacteria bacterium]|nr:pyridoxal phosphate-dependent aminotransferase [Betaproteobacteria bacterium]
MKLAARMNDIAPFHVMELMARAKALEAAGRSIIHMEVGEPDFPTPQPILDAASAFIREGHVFYTHALGLPQLRQAIADFYAARYNVEVSPERIIVTAGASGALLLALGALIDPGDELLLPDPGYPCNRHFTRLFEGRPTPLNVGPENHYQPTAAQVAAAWTPRTRGLLAASPANPTGALLDRSRLAALWQTVAERGGALLVDEIYHGLTYGGRSAETALAISDEIFVINSFSKYFNMTGWRLGWLVAPARHVREIEKLAQNLFISPSAPAQHAALAAFQPAVIALLEQRRLEFQARRDLLLPGLRGLGFKIAAEPQGAFYIYTDCSGLADDSFKLAGELIEQAGVAVTPGLDFGGHAPERHLRFAYTVSQELLEEGLARLARHLR